MTKIDCNTSSTSLIKNNSDKSKFHNNYEEEGRTFEIQSKKIKKKGTEKVDNEIRENKIQQEEEEEEEEEENLGLTNEILIDRLLKTCEEAYEEGANSVDIYKVLNSSELIKLALSPNPNTNINNKNSLNEGDEKDYGKKSRGRTIIKFIGRVHSILFKLSWCVILTFLSYLILCHLMDVSPLYFFPSIMEKRCLLQAHPVLLEMSRPIANCSICTEFQETGSPVIEFKNVPLKEEFHSVVYSSRPIIVRGGAFRLGMTNAFDFAKLKALFNSETDGVESVSKECQFLPFRSPFETLREAFDTISDTATWDRPWYIGWSNCHPGVAAKLRKLFPRPHFLPEDSESSAIDWIFIGSPGLGASMHIDYVRRPSWQAQLSGEKKWILRPPPECEHICPNFISFTIHPGDMLFVETNLWYHETLIQGSNLSISIGSEYD